MNAVVPPVARHIETRTEMVRADAATRIGGRSARERALKEIIRQVLVKGPALVASF